MTGTQFFDSYDINGIPGGATHAALYGDGDFKVTTAEARRFRYRRWITVLGTPSCGLADYEPGNEVYGRRGALRAWAAQRHGQYAGLPIVYVDRALAAQAVAQLDGLRVLFWIPTLDGNEHWTPELLSANMASGDNGTVPPVTIPPSLIWANQWRNSESPPFDESTLFGNWWA